MQTEEEKEGVRLAKKQKDIISYARFSIVVNLMLFYGIAIGIWGLALKLNLLYSALVGIILGLIIAFTFGLSTILTKPKNWNELGDRKFFLGIWQNIAMLVGATGLIVWIIRVLFSL